LKPINKKQLSMSDPYLSPIQCIQKRVLYEGALNKLTITDRAKLKSDHKPLPLFGKAPLDLTEYVVAKEVSSAVARHMLQNVLLVSKSRVYTCHLNELVNVTDFPQVFYIKDDSNVMFKDAPGDAFAQTPLNVTHYNFNTLPKDIRMVLEYAKNRYDHKKADLLLPLPIDSIGVYESPIIYLLWIIWYAAQIWYSNGDHFASTYIDFLQKAIKSMIEASNQVISYGGIMVTDTSRLSDVRHISLQSQQSTETIIYNDGNGELLLKQELVNYETWDVFSRVIPDKQFCIALDTIFKWCYDWLTIDLISYNQVNASLKIDGTRISLLRIYERYATHYKPKRLPTTNLIKAIYSILQGSRIDITTHEFNVAYIKDLNETDYVAQAIMRQLNTNSWVRVQTVAANTVSAVAATQYTTHRLIDQWLLVNIDKGGWNIDVQKASHRLASWLQCNGNVDNTQWTNRDECEMLLRYLEELSKSPQYHLWLTSTQMEKLSRSITTEVKRNIPFFVHLSSKARQLTIYYRQFDGTHKTIDLDLMRFNRFYPNLSITDFLLLVEVLHRQGGKTTADPTNFKYINGTVEMNITSPIRNNQPNEFSSPKELERYVKSIKNLPKDFINVYYKDEIKGLEYYTNVFEFINRQANDESNEKFIQLKTDKFTDKYKTSIICNIPGYPWLTYIQEANRNTSYTAANPYKAYHDATDKQAVYDNDLNVRYLMQRPEFKKPSAKIILPTRIELDLCSVSRSNIIPPNPLFVIPNLPLHANYVRYFYVWLGIDNSIANDSEFRVYTTSLNDAYQSTTEQWLKKLESYLVYTKNTSLYFQRLLFLYIAYYHGLLCPFMMHNINRLQDYKYTLEKVIMLNACKNEHLSQRFFLTLSYTIPGQFVMVGYHKEPILITFQAEDIMQTPGHPLTKLYSFMFTLSRGMLPLYRQDLFNILLKHNVLNSNSDAIWNSSTITCHSIMFPNNSDQRHVTKLFHQCNEIEHLIATFFIQERTDGQALFKQIDALSDHSARNFLDLALCTSGQFIDKIRRRHRKRFPFRTNNGETSKYNDLCNELLAPQNITNHTTIKASQLKPPAEFLTTQNRFDTNNSKAQEWLLKHYGFAHTDIEGIATQEFNASSTSTIPTKQITMIIHPMPIEHWFYKYVFRFMNDTMLTEDYIRFINDATILLQLVNNATVKTTSTPTITPLITSLFQTARDEWQKFIEHVANHTFDNKPVRSLDIQLIYKEINERSPNQEISKLLQRQLINIQRLPPKERVETWMRQEIFNSSDRGYDYIAILTIYNLLLLLVQYHLIS
jgi:DNA-binding protein